MTEPKGYVVDHLQTGVRYAVSAPYFNPDIHRKVRPLEPHEQVRGYPLKPHDPRPDADTGQGTPSPDTDEPDQERGN